MKIDRVNQMRKANQKRLYLYMFVIKKKKGTRIKDDIKEKGKLEQE